MGQTFKLLTWTLVKCLRKGSQVASKPAMLPKKLYLSLSKCKVAESSDNQDLKSGLDKFFQWRRMIFFSSLTDN